MGINKISLIIIVLSAGMVYGQAVPTFHSLYWRSVVDGDNPVHQPLSADSTTFFQVLDADGGTPVFNIDSTNERVGIGTATPVGQFDVSGDLTNPPVLYMHNTYDGAAFGTGDVLGGFYLYSDDVSFGPAVLGGLKWVQSGNAGWPIGDLVFSTGFTEILEANTERMRIKANNGFVGINFDSAVITNPEAHLHVYRRDTSTSESRILIKAEIDKDTGGWGGAEIIQAFFSDPDIAAFFGLQTYYAFYANASNIAGTINNPYAFVSESGAGKSGFGETAPETMLEITDAEPYITLHNSTHEDSDGGRESIIQFFGEQSGGEETTLAKITVQHDGAADDQKGEMLIYTNDGSDGDTPTAVIKVDSAQSTYIGDGGTATYIQVDSAGDTYWVGDGSGLAYGSCSNGGTHLAWSQVNPTQNTWYDISDADMVDGQLNLVTHDGNGQLTVTKAGRYLINWSMCAETTVANKHLEFAISVNAAENTQGMSHYETKAVSAEFAVASTAILDLAASSTINLSIRTIDAGVVTLTVDCIELTLTQIGGT